MTPTRPPVHLTTRVLTFGSLTAAVILGVGLVFDFAYSENLGPFLGDIGVVVLLLTPVAGLIATWWELRGPRPVHGWLAVAVLVVLVLATLIALLARP
ncbi:MAG TPA: hypothetical protein VM284_02895 [Candidatus Limnocylindria bacterium]|nr:hypothetical protein [Candidatus Limnocylindria bacterium]